jgi:hypothetical protein
MPRWSRLSVRIRVTLAFAGVMAVVLTATGLRLGAELDTTIEQSLRSRAGDVTALIEQAGSGLEEAGLNAEPPHAALISRPSQSLGLINRHEPRGHRLESWAPRAGFS